MTKIIPEDNARQGHWGRHALIILVSSLLLAFIAWGGVEIYGHMLAKQAPVEQTQGSGAAPAG